jgi:hypothetical protein
MTCTIHDQDQTIVVCRPTPTRRVRWTCPFHKRLCYGTLYEQEYYDPSVTFDCGTEWMESEGWLPPRCFWCSAPVKTAFRADGKVKRTCGTHARWYRSRRYQEVAA